ncbi:MAG TPA: AraC family transcriptional regulator, partial [Blastocatellia bacterium]|nr:AraC family transcriptional regulator [Blastocatellia bacterium]
MTNREIQKIVSRPQFTVRHTATDECEFEPHSHASFTVTAILRGRLSVAIEADRFEAAAGQVVLTNLGQNHAASGRHVEFVSVGLSPAVLNELVAEFQLTRTTAEIVFRASMVEDHSLTEVARLIAAETTGESVGHELMLDAMVRQMVIHLLRSHMTVRKSARVELSRAGPVDRRLRRAIEFMHDNFARELSLEEIASAAYLSEYHFARLFKQITGSTVHVYLAN